MNRRKFEYITGWHKRGLTCSKCGEARSVKYRVEGMPYCNMCVAIAARSKENEND